LVRRSRRARPAATRRVARARTCIDRAFSALRAERRAAFIPYLTAGDPSLEATADLAETLAGAGADLIEIGVPFSDPLADGPTIQRASERALAAGVTLSAVLAAVSEIRRRIDTPIVLMSYLNPVVRFGLERFAREARGAGADGAILTDLPVEEAGPAVAALDAAGLDLVFLAAPTSGEARLARIAGAARGFVYAITRTGVTGARSELPAEMRRMIAAIRRVTEKPIALGFGISTPEQVREAARLADAVVVGSAIVDLVGRHGADPERMLREVGQFAGALSAPLREPRRGATPVLGAAD
jgi:tryptophan synthase alpha chain